MDNLLKTNSFSNSATYFSPSESSDVQGVKQHFPGTSIQESVQAALADIKQGALEEAKEEASLALGGKLRDLKLVKDKLRSEVDRNKEMLDKLIKQITQIDPAQLAQLAAKYPGASDAADPLMFLRQAGASNAEIALILGFLLASGGLSAKQRKRLEKAMQDIIEESDALGIDLFTFLEFGPATSQVTTQLKRIYQKACDDDLELKELFNKLKGLPDRNRKLKALIRGLAFELSSQGEVAQGSKMAAVIMDLRKLLLFFGLDRQCDQIALMISNQGTPLSGPQVLEELILMIDQAWLYSDWMDSRLSMLGFADRFAYLRNIQEMIKYMPDPCFSDEDQRIQILEVCTEVQEMYADRE